MKVCPLFVSDYTHLLILQSMYQTHQAICDVSGLCILIFLCCLTVVASIMIKVLNTGLILVITTCWINTNSTFQAIYQIELSGSTQKKILKCVPKWVVIGPDPYNLVPVFGHTEKYLVTYWSNWYLIPLLQHIELQCCFHNKAQRQQSKKIIKFFKTYECTKYMCFFPWKSPLN